MPITEKSPSFKKYVQRKVKKNIEEYRKGRWRSPQQAIAVAYSQARKKFGIKRKNKFSTRK
jgi:hypothetical protein